MVILPYQRVRLRTGTGGVRGCTVRMPDDRERGDATLLGTALEPKLEAGKVGSRLAGEKGLL